MLETVLASGVRVEEVYVDTVGDPWWYEKKLNEVFNSGRGGGGGMSGRGFAIKFTVSKKADSLFKVVSAASIAAKVVRDRALPQWIFQEPAFSHFTKMNSPTLTVGTGCSNKGKKAMPQDFGENMEKRPHVSVENCEKGGALEGKNEQMERGGGMEAANAFDEEVDDDEEDNDDDDEEEEEEEEGYLPLDVGESVPPIPPNTVSQSAATTTSTAVAAKKRKRRAAAESSRSAPPTEISFHPSSAGSGYPSDPATKLWVETFFDPVFGWSNVVRFSWAPAQKALKDSGVPCLWGDDESVIALTPTHGQASIKTFFSASGPVSTSSANSLPPQPGRGFVTPAWCRRRCLVPLGLL